MKKTARWKTAPISPTCDCAFNDVIVIVGNQRILHPRLCYAPTRYAYPARGGGWMALCEQHARQHLPSIQSIEALILSGETFQ